MRGLDSKWNGPKIYCSKTTKSLLVNMFKISPEKVYALEMNKKYELEYGEDENEDESTFFVTLIDANHCPGAVMFLFEGPFGTVLAAGDFRYTPKMFQNSPLNNVTVDLCYLDNTYFKPSCSNFPSQSNATNAIVQLIDLKLNENKNTVFGIKMNNLGKENLLVELCERFNAKVAVSERRFVRYTTVLNIDPKHFSKNISSDTLFFVLNDEIHNLNGLKRMSKFIINPSALHIDTARLNVQNLVRLALKSRTTSAQIPYSEHSSYNEIIEFIKMFRRRRIVPTVYSDPDCLKLDRLEPFLKTVPVVERRQFSCNRCDRWWWEKAEASNCQKCKVLYEPVPIEEEFGVCFFKCACSNEFSGFASKKIRSECYTCGRNLLPIEVREKKTISKKTESKRSCQKCRGLDKCLIYGKVLYASDPVSS